MFSRSKPSQPPPEPGGKNRDFPWRWAAGGGFLVLAVVAVLLSRTDGNASGLELKPEAPPVKVESDNAAVGLEQAFIHVAAAVGPAVVNISAEWTERITGMPGFGSMDDFFNFWFYGPGGPPGGPPGGAPGDSPRRAPEMKRKQKGLGSGFIITSDGYILTNAHVLGKAEKITVTLQDGREFPARVIGKDEKTDIGLIKIDGKDLPHAVLGDSDAIEVGQWAVAIGNPFALDHTVTTGVISAKGRAVLLNEQSPYQSYIQTDASINPGNSGGPLCNIRGEVIGINTAIFSQTGGSVGIGFAIPVNIAKKVARDLSSQGRVIRAGLGATVQSLDYNMAKSFGLETAEGALLSNIGDGSAAKQAGLKAGDIVLDIDGKTVTSAADLVALLYTKVPGDKVKLTVLRDKRRYKFDVTLQALEEKTAKTKEEAPAANDVHPSVDQLGLMVQDPTPQIKAQLPTGAPKGPVVTGVDGQSPAASAGLQPGDVVLKVDDREVATAAELSRAFKAKNLKQGVRLFVWREGTTLYLFLSSED